MKQLAAAAAVITAAAVLTIALFDNRAILTVAAVLGAGAATADLIDSLRDYRTVSRYDLPLLSTQAALTVRSQAFKLAVLIGFVVIGVMAVRALDQTLATTFVLAVIVTVDAMWDRVDRKRMLREIRRMRVRRTTVDRSD